MRKGTAVLLGFGVMFLLLGVAIPGQSVCADADREPSTLDRCSRLADGTPEVRSPFVYYGLGGVLAASGVLFELFRSADGSGTESNA